MSGVLRRGWLLIAQAIAISAGVLIAWRAFEIGRASWRERVCLAV